MVFDRVIYRPAEGFPIANELVANTTSPTNCCIACHNTVSPHRFPPNHPTNNPQANCAGSFYAPSLSECHLRLTSPAPPSLPGNATSTASPTPTTALSPLSTSAPPNSCAAGSMSLYMGTIRGQEDFPEPVALFFSNGPCGRFSVSPVPVDREESDWRRGVRRSVLRLGRS